jgi:hypothetical protein
VADEPRIYAAWEWGSSWRDTRRLKRREAEGATLHHTASANAQVLADPVRERGRCFALARAIQADHLRRGYADSGHHFLVTRSGLILEGRRGSLDLARKGLVIAGAHAGDNAANTLTFGVECEGLYSHEAPPDALWDALVELAAYLSMWGGYQAAAIEGHRHYKATQCPGDRLAARLPSLRLEVKEKKSELLLLR